MDAPQFITHLYPRSLGKHVPSIYFLLHVRVFGVLVKVGIDANDLERPDDAIERHVKDAKSMRPELGQRTLCEYARENDTNKWVVVGIRVKER